VTEYLPRGQTAHNDVDALQIAYDPAEHTGQAMQTRREAEFSTIDINTGEVKRAAEPTPSTAPAEDPPATGMTCPDATTSAAISNPDAK
jgi:hypothetical protein